MNTKFLIVIISFFSLINSKAEAQNVIFVPETSSVTDNSWGNEPYFPVVPAPAQAPVYYDNGGYYYNYYPEYYPQYYQQTPSYAGNYNGNVPQVIPQMQPAQPYYQQPVPQYQMQPSLQPVQAEQPVQQEQVAQPEQSEQVSQPQPEAVEQTEQPVEAQPVEEVVEEVIPEPEVVEEPQVSVNYAEQLQLTSEQVIRAVELSENSRINQEQLERDIESMKEQINNLRKNTLIDFEMTLNTEQRGILNELKNSRGEDNLSLADILREGNYQ